MRIAAYMRVSTERQAVEGDSIEDQRAHIQEWAIRHSATIVEEYVEAGASAHIDRRPVFERMMFEAKRRPAPYDAVVVYSQSRFYRDNMKREVAVRALEERNVAVISVTEPLPEDEPTKILIRNVTGIIAEHQSRENSMRVRSCQKINAQNGYYNGAPTPFGYTTVATDIASRSGFKKRLVVHGEEAPIVRQIFSWAADGIGGEACGFKRIATILNERGITLRGRPWRKQAIAVILANETYVGRYVSFKTEARTRKVRPATDWVVVNVEPVVDEETFVRARKSVESRCIERRESKAELSPTLLTGLLVCDGCGKHMTLMTGKSGRYHYYRCATKQNASVRGCTGPNLPRKELDEAVLSAISSRLLTAERIETLMREMSQALRAAAEPDLKRLQATQRSLAQEERRLATLFEQISDSELKIDDFLKKHIEAVRAKMADLQQEISQMETKQQIPLRKFGRTQIDQFIDELKHEFAIENSTLARSYLRAVVKEIRVGPAGLRLCGSSPQLAAAISYHRPGQILTVPRFVSDWRTLRGANRKSPIWGTRSHLAA